MILNFLLNINEYLIASIRGVIIYKIDSSLKASIIPIIPLNEISDKDSLYFYSFFENKIKENLFKKKRTHLNYLIVIQL